MLSITHKKWYFYEDSEMESYTTSEELYVNGDLVINAIEHQEKQRILGFLDALDYLKTPYILREDKKKDPSP